MIKERKPKVTIRGEYYGHRTLPSLNDYLNEVGRNPKAGAKFKADYTKPIINAIRRCLKGWKVTHPPIILHYEFYESKKGKRRDVMNIFTLADKYFQDALQQTGTIENDNPDWVENTTHFFHWIDEEPYIEIEIEERGTSNVTERENTSLLKNAQKGNHTANSLREVRDIKTFRQNMGLKK